MKRAPSEVPLDRLYRTRSAQLALRLAWNSGSLPERPGLDGADPPTHRLVQARPLELTPEHLLVGLLATDDSVARRVLATLSVSPVVLAREFGVSAANLNHLWPTLDGPHRYGSAVRGPLSQASRLARDRGYPAFGTDHLLLALTESSTLAGDVLRAAGVTPERVAAELDQLDEADRSAARRGRPQHDLPPGIQPWSVALAGLVLLLAGFGGLFLLLVVLGMGGGTSFLIAAVALTWNLAFCFVTADALAGGRERGWSCAMLWLGEKSCLVLGGFLAAAVPHCLENSNPLPSLLAVAALVALLTTLVLLFLAQLFLRRDWFTAALRDPWKTLLRQGGISLAITLVLDLLPILAPALQQWGAAFRSKP